MPPRLEGRGRVGFVPPPGALARPYGPPPLFPNVGSRANPPQSILDLIGHTPAIPLPRVGRGVPYRILAKLEFLNPGGSVKDRIGTRMIEEAEAKGWLKPGGTIVEATSGNTGVGPRSLRPFGATGPSS